MPNLTLSHFSFALLHSAHISSPRARFFAATSSERARELEALALRACGNMVLVVKRVGAIQRDAAACCTDLSLTRYGNMQYKEINSRERA